MTGFMPRRSVAKALQDGSLKIVAEAPAFPFSAYVVWNQALEASLVAQIVMTSKNAQFARHEK